MKSRPCKLKFRVCKMRFQCHCKPKSPCELNSPAFVPPPSPPVFPFCSQNGGKITPQCDLGSKIWGDIFPPIGGKIFRISLKTTLNLSFRQPAAGAARKLTFFGVSNQFLNAKPSNSFENLDFLGNRSDIYFPPNGGKLFFELQIWGEIFPPIPPIGGKI